MSAVAEASQKIAEAIMSFGQAALSGVFLKMNIDNKKSAMETAKKQQSEEKDDFSAKISANKTKNAELENENISLNKQIDHIKNPIVDMKPGATPSTLTEAETAKIGTLQAKIDANNSEIKLNNKANDKLSVDINTTDTKAKINEKFNIEINRLTHISDLQKSVLENVMRACGGLIGGTLTEIKGALDALKALFQGYLDAMHKSSDSASKAADSIKQAFDSIIDFINKITDSISRAHSLGNA
jgi:hypothetical protein